MMNSRAGEIADDVLFPDAALVDRADRVPASHLDLLAQEGFYGAGLDDDLSLSAHLVETFAGGCLATAFVWLQHRGPLRAVAHSDQPGVRATWLTPLASGEVRGGIAYSGARPGAVGLRAYQTAEGWRLDGAAAWVTGWDLIDVLHVAAVDDAGQVRFFLLDAVESDSLRTRPHELTAARASRTVTAIFRDHPVPADRFVAAQPYAGWSAREASGSALNGFLAVGVAARCLRLLGDAPIAVKLAAELEDCRAALLAADATATPAARAAVSELAMRCATVLAVHTGSRSVLLDSPAQRLVREAAFLLVFGTRPAIRDELLHRLAH